MSGLKNRRVAGFDPQRCVDFLRAAHPVKTAAAIAAETHGIIPARTAERWLSGQAAPSGPAVFALIAAYGPAFIAAALPGLNWIEEAAMRAERDRLNEDIRILHARQGALAARLGDRG